MILRGGGGSDLMKARVNSMLGAHVFDLPRRNVIDFQRWFVEDERWMRTFAELLLSDDAASRNYLNAETIRGYLDPDRSWKPGDLVKLVYIVSFELYLRSLRP